MTEIKLDESYWTWIAKHFMEWNAVGWIDDKGYMFGVSRWEHMKYFIEVENACPAVTNILQPAWEEFLEPYLDKHRSEDRRWHEWSDPEMNLDEEILAEARSAAYWSGWGRLGSLQTDKLELECASEHKDRLSKQAKKLAELLNRELIVTVQEPYSRPNLYTGGMKP